MKVLFTFGGLPHYLNPILNRLNAVVGLDITVAIPKNSSGTLGDNVKVEKAGIEFKVIYLNEKKAFYGNYYFSNLLEAIESEKPEIVVIIWPYILDVVINKKIKRCLKKNNIKLILKEIPFDVPRYEDTFSYYKSKYARSLNEDKELNIKLTPQFYLKHIILRKLRTYYYQKLLDASVNYVDEAIEIAGSYGMPKEKIFISTNSPDTDLIFEAYNKVKTEPPILPRNKYRIVHVGRLVKWKRVDLLIDAVCKLVKDYPSIELLVIGNGKEEVNLKNQAQSLDLSNNVRFIGGVYDNNTLGKYLLESSIYVLAGMGGLSINQAMAFGKPVICSIADGTEKKLVKDSFNGYYFKNSDPKDLAKKINKLLSDPDLLETFGRNSLSIIKNEVNVHTVIEGYLKAFNYVTNNKFMLKEDTA